MEQIIDFGIDAGDLRDQLAVFLGLCGDQAVGLYGCAQVGDDDFGIFFGVRGFYECAMERWAVGLGPIINLASIAAPRKEFRVRYEVGVRFDLVCL